MSNSPPHHPRWTRSWPKLGLSKAGQQAKAGPNAPYWPTQRALCKRHGAPGLTEADSHQLTGQYPNLAFGDNQAATTRRGIPHARTPTSSGPAYVMGRRQDHRPATKHAARAPG
eukprot:scaffold166848_cov39-Prasinocladus_malaysianus.AAC.1